MIPKIKEGVISSVLHEIEGPSKDPNWVANMLTKINNYDPIMAAYFRKVKKQQGEECMVMALVAYKIIESQIEANQMDQDFGD